MKVITLKGILFCLQGIFVHMAVAQAQGGEHENLVIKFLDIVQENVYQKSNIDWPAARESFLEETVATKSEAELEPHFAGFLKTLSDSHSSISYMVDDEDELDVLERYAYYLFPELGDNTAFTSNHEPINKAVAWIRKVLGVVFSCST